MKKVTLSLFAFSLGLILVHAQKKTKDVLAKLDDKKEFYSDIAQEIWGLAEMGYQEKQSSALLQKTLKDAGFNITAGVAGIPTAFVAEYGSGSPIIGIMGEYDASRAYPNRRCRKKVPLEKRPAMPVVTICSAPLPQPRRLP